MWVVTILIALAGFDPISAILYMAIAAAGASRRSLAAFGLACLLSTEALSVAAVLGLSQLLDRIRRHLPRPTHDDVAVAVIVAGVLLIAWGLWRLLRTAKHQPVERTPRTPKTFSPLTLGTTGVLIGLAFVTDPTWWAMVAFAGSLEHRGQAIVAATLWTVACQILLVVLVIALALGRDAPVREAIQRARVRWEIPLARLLTGLLLAAGVGGVVGGLVTLR